MAERGTNFYYPPDFDPKKHRSANGYQGVHHLRERARKIDQGIIIIRFEMPFNVWCDGCNNHIGMGVRYNAQKTKVGNYYSTIIYKFKMKCHLCDNWFEIQTDPKNLDYEIVSGLRRQERRWNPEDNEQIIPVDRKDSDKKETNAMFRLEHEAQDKAKLVKEVPVLERISAINERMRDDYSSNQLLRKGMRVRRKEAKDQQEKDKKLLSKSSLSIALLPESEEDRKVASLLTLKAAFTRDVTSKSRKEEQLRRLAEAASRRKISGASREIVRRSLGRMVGVKPTSSSLA